MNRIFMVNRRFGTVLLAALSTFVFPTMARSITKNGKIFVASTGDFVGDGKTDNTQQIQAAIDSCNAAGGGIVEFSAGTFLTGPIILKSNVTFELDSAATLWGRHTRRYIIRPVTIQIFRRRAHSSR